MPYTECERCGADCTNDPEIDNLMCGHCVQLEEDYYAEQAVIEAAKPVTGTLLPDELQTGDLFINQYLQLAWTITNPPQRVNDPDGYKIHVEMTTGEKLVRIYPDHENWRFTAKMVGQHRVITTIKGVSA